MATTDYDFISTRNEIIQRAFRLIGNFALGEVLSADQINQAIVALNQVVKSWQSKHIFLWTLTPLSQSLTATTKSYSLASTDPKVIAIDRACIRTSGRDEAIEVVSWRKYQDIARKDDPGEPSCVAIDHKEDPTMYVWPVPTVSSTLYYLAITKLKDWDTSSTTADFPVRFQNALTFALAEQLSHEYALPLPERNLLKVRADELFLEAIASDREREDYEYVTGAFPRGRFK